MSTTLPLDVPVSPKPYALTPQRDIGRCQFCSEPEEQERPFVAVLTNIDKTSRHFVHAGQCHEDHRARVKSEREERARARRKAA